MKQRSILKTTKNKKMKKILIQLRKQIEKDYGRKCQYFCEDCVVCQVYKLLEDLEEIIN